MAELALVRREKLAAVLKRRGLTPSDMGRLTGKRPSYYSDLLNGKKSFGEKAARTIEDELGLQLGALDDPDDNPAHAGASIRGADTVRQIFTRLVPVVSWESRTPEALATQSSAQAINWILCPVPHSSSTFAAEVQGDGMVGPAHMRSYPAGSIIYVDPEVAPATGRPVLALLQSKQLVLRIYRDEAGQRWLQALNPAYPSITDEFTVVGPVIGMFSPT